MNTTWFLLSCLGTLGIICCSALDVFEVVEKAGKRVQEKQLKTPRSGLHRRRKWTHESRAMTDRYNWIRETAEILKDEHAMEEEEAVNMAKQSVNRAIKRSAIKASKERSVRNYRNYQHDKCAAGQCKETLPLVTRNTCTFLAICTSNAPYRTIDGTCNNRNNPLWGAMSTKNIRFVPANYANGVDEPRGGFTHQLKNERNNACVDRGDVWLPNARMISKTLHLKANIENSHFTHMLTQVAQFLDHDITLATEEEVEECCEHPERENCFPIEIPHNDSYIRIRDCMEFTRSTPFCPDSQNIREQFNALTAFVDGSNIYGSDDETASLLRSFQRGELKVTLTNENREMLPLINDEYIAGDIRAQDMPGLASMHTLFMREHNRIARRLYSMDSSQSDEEIYQRARRTVIAEWQNIIYEEWLPNILGRNTVLSTNLVQAEGTRSTYDPNVNPSILIDFSTAAFRFGHTIVQELIMMLDVRTNALIQHYRLKDNFFNLDNYFSLSGLGMEQIINGLINQPAQTYDRYVAEDLTNHLFENNEGMSSDLIARNIQRARDHGMPGYNSYRKECGMNEICSWNDRPNEIPKDSWDILQSLYHHPSDIELFPAGLSEVPYNGGLVGRTFNCIIQKQFKNLKDGDRYFYTHNGSNGVSNPFTNDELEAIRRRTLQVIICDNTSIKRVKKYVFQLDSWTKFCCKSKFFI